MPFRFEPPIKKEFLEEFSKEKINFKKFDPQDYSKIDKNLSFSNYLKKMGFIIIQEMGFPEKNAYKNKSLEKNSQKITVLFEGKPVALMQMDC